MIPHSWPIQKDGRISYISGPPDAEYCRKAPRSAVILGSTGSIGRNALAIIEQREDFFQMAGLAGGRNMELLARQAIRHKPAMLAVFDETRARELRELLPAAYQPEILIGPRGYAEMASRKNVDCVLAAQSGAAGLPGALAAALAGKVIALANKESIVLAGALFRSICAESKAVILPVDSEHFAVFQCLGAREDVAEIFLTASGGPFRNKSRQELRHVSVQDALKHPNWRMGAKITIDSATLMNKGFEIIEAANLFGLKIENIKAVVHPQSLIHALVRFADNSVLAQMAVPDMKLPIADCLLWPHAEASFIKPLDLLACGELTFAAPDEKAFPCLALAREAASREIPEKWERLGINPACVILNAANEIAVELFLNNSLAFCDIPALIELTLKHFTPFCEEPEYASRNVDAPDMALAYVNPIAKLDEKSREYARAAARELTAGAL